MSPITPLYDTVSSTHILKIPWHLCSLHQPCQQQNHSSPVPFSACSAFNSASIVHETAFFSGDYCYLQPLWKMAAKLRATAEDLATYLEPTKTIDLTAEKQGCRDCWSPSHRENQSQMFQFHPLKSTGGNWKQSWPLRQAAPSAQVPHQSELCPNYRATEHFWRKNRLGYCSLGSPSCQSDNNLVFLRSLELDSSSVKYQIVFSSRLHNAAHASCAPISRSHPVCIKNGLDLTGSMAFGPITVK